MSSDTNFKGFHMKQSPFHEESKESGEMVSFRLEKDVKEKLERHFREVYDEQSKGYKNLCHRKLDSLCLERKTFNHLEVFMLIPKTEDINELENKSQIIAIVNTECDFQDFYVHNLGFDDDYNLSYELQDFNQTSFPLNILLNTKDSCVHKIDKSCLKSFPIFKMELDRVYHSSFNGDYFDIDVNDCYFVRFPLNNYLDEWKEGQYQHETFRENHIGAYVFQDVQNGLKLYCFIDWYYLADFDLNVHLDFQFVSDKHFIFEGSKSDDDEFKEAMKEAMSDKARKEHLLKFKEQLETNLSFIDDLLETLD